MCDDCKLWCDGPVKGESMRLIQSLNRGLNPSVDQNLLCKFDGWYPQYYGDRLYCHGCHRKHPVKAFPHVTLGDAPRLCFVHQGIVRLCEHVGISWSTVEEHLRTWQKRAPGDWQGCLENFAIECRHPSHDTGCSSAGAPPWPRAFLEEVRYDGEDKVILTMEWSAHSGVDAFSQTPGGRPPASEMRALFQSHRRRGQVADILLPMHPGGPLPEMICFDPNRCDCLDYGSGDISQANLPGQQPPTSASPLQAP
jgi:hypothetical protein